ncbi:MAG: hypothetical protein ACSI46_01570 [Gloeotrichia echinulata DVL01]|nr:hypothetical protein [Gloeotrichia echinulata DEX184]
MLEILIAYIHYDTRKPIYSRIGKKKVKKSNRLVVKKKQLTDHGGNQATIQNRQNVCTEED